MKTVYWLTLRQLSGRWRILIMAVLAALPVLIAVLSLADDDAGSVTDFENFVISAMLSGTIAPMIVLAIAAAAFANEVEDRTIANLSLAPLPRWQIVVPKLLASITLAGPFIVVSAFFTSHVAFLMDWRASLAVTGAALVGVALYAAVFTWLGLMSTQAIGIGLLYIVLWEGFFSRFVAGVRLFSVRYYAIAMMHALDERRFARTDILSPTLAVVTSVLVFAGFTLLAIRRLKRMDIP